MLHSLIVSALPGCMWRLIRCDGHGLNSRFALTNEWYHAEKDILGHEILIDNLRGKHVDPPETVATFLNDSRSLHKQVTAGIV
jgi:hypothetical protein